MIQGAAAAVMVIRTAVRLRTAAQRLHTAAQRLRHRCRRMIAGRGNYRAPRILFAPCSGL
jgi:hypothetical protein